MTQNFRKPNAKEADAYMLMREGVTTSHTLILCID